MDDDELRKLRSIAWVTQARMDVLERVIVDYLLFTNPGLAAAAEDSLRHAHERSPPPPSDNPELIEKHRLANEAAVRLSDLLAQGLAKKG